MDWLSILISVIIAIFGGGGDGGETPAPSALCSPVAPGRYDVNLEGRNVIIRVPDGYVGDPIPMVLNLHGRSSNAGQQMTISQAAIMADTHDTFVVAPNAVGGVWQLDDVAYLSRVIDYMQANYCIDPGEIFVMGLSQGGGYAARLACADIRIESVGVVSGFQFGTDDIGCQRQVPLIAIHGTWDFIVPYQVAAADAATWDEHVFITNARGGHVSTWGRTDAENRIWDYFQTLD